MTRLSITLSFGLCVLALGTACTSTPPPQTVYQDVRTAIQIHKDSQAGSGHSHPATLQVEQMVRILSGIRVQRDRQAVHRMLAGEADTASAFTVPEVLTLAPQLVKALSSAKPDELVTFYRRVSDASTGLAYTTGGLLMRGGHLHLVLANYRQSPADAMSLGIPAYERDPYDTPLSSLRRAGYTVTYSPKEAEVHPVAGQWQWDFPDPGKVVIINPALVFFGSADSAGKGQSVK